MTIAAAAGNPASRGGEVSAARTLAAAAWTVDDRTFEQRFGDRCPFCNKTWDDRNSCAPVDPGWTWRDQMNNSFRNRRLREAPPTSTRICVRCLREYEGIAGQMYCGKRCLDQSKSARYREAHSVTKQCAWCGEDYEGKPTSSYCSLSHAMKGRHAKARGQEEQAA